MLDVSLLGLCLVVIIKVKYKLFRFYCDVPRAAHYARVMVREVKREVREKESKGTVHKVRHAKFGIFDFLPLS